MPLENFLPTPLNLENGKYFSESEVAEAAKKFTKQFVSKDSQSEIESLREEFKEKNTCAFFNASKQNFKCIVGECTLMKNGFSPCEEFKRLQKDYDWFKEEAFKKSAQLKELESKLADKLSPKEE